MNMADEALADVRGWLCDNLSESDAGKGCGMLSVVSRHITELDNENAKLCELVRYMHRCYVIGHDWGLWGAPEKQHVEDIMRELGIEVDA